MRHLRMRQNIARHDRDVIAMPQKRQDHVRRQLIRLKCLANPHLPQQPVRRDANPRPRLMKRPARRFQIANTDSRASSKRVIARGQNDHRAVKQPADAFGLASAGDFRWAKRHIDHPILQHLSQNLAVSLAHIQPDARVVAGEIGDRLGKGMKAQRRGAANAQFGIIAAPQIIGQCTDPPFGKDDGAGFGQNALAKCGRHDALPGSDHQLEPQPSLHQLHVAGQGRLCQPKRDGRPGKRPCADDFMELQKVAWIDGAHGASYQKLMRGGKRIATFY